jgi:hypothetical protein
MLVADHVHAGLPHEPAVAAAQVRDRKARDDGRRLQQGHHRHRRRHDPQHAQGAHQPDHEQAGQRPQPGIARERHHQRPGREHDGERRQGARRGRAGAGQRTVRPHPRHRGHEDALALDREQVRSLQQPERDHAPQHSGQQAQLGAHRPPRPAFEYDA